MLPADAGELLLPLARAAIGAELGRPGRVPDEVDWLAEPGASFVTLMIGDQLRGCIGTLLAYRPLAADVAANAQRAAFADRRFAPLQASEFDQIVVEVSVLTEPEALDFVDLTDAASQLRPGVDGVVLHRGAQRATLLPQVWEQLPQPAAFLKALVTKAGLTGWDDQIVLQRYQVQAWAESDGDPAAASDRPV